MEFSTVSGQGVLSGNNRPGFGRITYTEAIAILKRSRTGSVPRLLGLRLQTEHERLPTEQHFKAHFRD